MTGERRREFSSAFRHVTLFFPLLFVYCHRPAACWGLRRHERINNDLFWPGRVDSVGNFCIRAPARETGGQDAQGRNVPFSLAREDNAARFRMEHRDGRCQCNNVRRVDRGAAASMRDRAKFDRPNNVPACCGCHR